MKRIFLPTFNQAFLDAWLLILRILSTGFMFTHGMPKLERLLSGNMRFGDPIGLGPEMSLVLATGAEVGCATLVLVGFATRLATIPLIFTMLVAAFIAHGDDPFSKMELPLLYVLLYVTLLVLGAGRYSVDFLLSQRSDK